MKTKCHLLFLAVLGAALSSLSACCADVDSRSQTTLPAEEQSVARNEKEKEVASLFDPSLAEANKVALLLRLKCEDDLAWGPLLSKLLLESADHQEILQAAILVKLRKLVEWQGTETALADYALNKKNPLRPRMIAVEGMARYSGHPAAKALVTIARGKEEQEALREAALEALLKVDPNLHVQTVEALFQDEPHLVSTLRRDPKETSRGSSALPMAAQKEQALQRALASTMENEAAFQLIQTLANGSQESTIRMLVARYPSETDKNKAEIALTVAKIAKRNPKAMSVARTFLSAAMTNDQSATLRHALHQCLLYLEGE